MTKITMMGMGKGFLKPEPARFIPADKAIRRSKGKGYINTNPAHKDCIAWTDKKSGALIFREEFEDRKYNEYVTSIEDSQGMGDIALTKNEYLDNILWG